MRKAPANYAHKRRIIDTGVLQQVFHSVFWYRRSRPSPKLHGRTPDPPICAYLALLIQQLRVHVGRPLCSIDAVVFLGDVSRECLLVARCSPLTWQCVSDCCHACAQPVRKESTGVVKARFEGEFRTLARGLCGSRLCSRMLERCRKCVVSSGNGTHPVFSVPLR